MSKESKIKAVLFDFDDTLVPTRHLYANAIDVCFAVFKDKTGHPISKEDFAEKYKKVKKETVETLGTVASSHNRAIYFQKLIEEMKMKMDFELVYELYDAFYEYVLSSLKPYEGAVELLARIKEEGKSVVIVSDGVSLVRIQKLNQSGIGKYVDHLVSSEEVGSEKPDEKPYKAAMLKADVNETECIFIGNNSKRDIAGAKRLGIISIRTDLDDNQNDKPKSSDEEADYTVKSLSEIKDIIQTIDND